MISIPDTEKTALIFGEKSVLYSELRQRVQQKLDKLAFSKNQMCLKISIDLPDSFTLLEWVIAAWSAHHCVFIVDQRLTDEEKQERIKRFQPDLCVQSKTKISRGISSFEGDIEDVIIPYSSEAIADKCHIIFGYCEKDEDDDSVNDDVKYSDLPGLVLFTSGSTRLPKQVVRTFSSLKDEWENYAKFEGSPKSTDRVFCLVPVSHSFGLLAATLHTLLQGGTVIYPSSVQAQDVTQIIRKFNVTHVYGVNFHYQLLSRYWRKAPPDFTHKPVFLSSGGKLDSKVLEEFKELFGFKIGQQYGMSEVGFISVDFKGYKPGSVGRISKHQESHIDSQGQLVLHLSRSPYTGNEGNWEKDGGCSESGYLYTQDVVRVDEDGYLFVVDRTNQQVSVGGLKVNLNEVESVLKSHPAIADCAVVACDHDVFGSQLDAFIVLKDKGAVSQAEVRAWLKEILAPHKVPRYIHTIDEIPYSAAGKILKGKLTLLR